MPSFIGFVPTPEERIESFFELAPVSSSDVVYDLGSGDGRLLFAALEKGAGRAVGVELNSEHINTAIEKAKSKGLKDKITFLQADMMDVNLSDASVIFCYLSMSAAETLKSKFEAELNKGTRVVMESFSVPGWEPVRVITAQDIGCGVTDFYLYIMPPKSNY